jgi:hypothetical protein
MRKDVDDDTIEIMLSPEQMRGLSSAAAAAADATAGLTATPRAAVASGTLQTNTAPQPSSTPKSPQHHWPAGGIAAIVGVTVVLGTLAALGAIAQRSTERQRVAAAVPAPAPVLTMPVAQQEPVAQSAEPVRFKNPFDHSEVFEFPPGTSQLEAREAVAQLLMERARDRHVQLIYRKHSAARRAATERIAGGPVGADFAQNSVRPR